MNGDNEFNLELLAGYWERPSKADLTVSQLIDADSVAITSSELEPPYLPLNFNEAYHEH